MCGIAGVLDRTASTPGDELAAAAAAMARTLAYRGPDGEATWVDEAAGVALGHRRLAVVDLSEAAAQPMTSACGRYVISFNGEIYNFGPLRQELAAAGHRFRGTGDTETLLTAISAWSYPVALERAEGMFAFALWDREERILHLARDRMGEKPLYYGRFGPTVLFGSELKALRAHRAFRADIDRDAVADLLALKYVPAPRSIFENVKKLPPATTLAIPAGSTGDLPDPVSYWSLPEQTAETHAGLGRARRPGRVAASRLDPGPDDRRRAGRGVPVRRHRLVDRGGPDAAGRRPRAHLHRRVRRLRLRRGPPRPGRGRSPGHRPHEGGPRRRRGPGRDPRPGHHLRRAVRRLLPDRHRADLPGRPPGRDRVPVRRRRRRAVRWLQPAPGGAPDVPPLRAPAPPDAPGRRTAGRCRPGGDLGPGGRAGPRPTPAPTGRQQDDQGGRRPDHRRTVGHVQAGGQPLARPPGRGRRGHSPRSPRRADPRCRRRPHGPAHAPRRRRPTCRATSSPRSIGPR